MRRVRVLGVVVMVVAAGCGEPGRAPAPGEDQASAAAEQSSSSRRPTACSLISREEMSRILGGEVGPPHADDQGDSSSCTYTPASGEGVVPYAQVSLSWQGGEGAMLGMRLAGDLVGQGGPKLVEKLSDLGDEATMMIGGLLYVRLGDAFFTVDLRMQESSREKGVAIARKVLQGLAGAA